MRDSIAAQKPKHPHKWTSHAILPEVILEYVPFRGEVSTPTLYRLVCDHYGSLNVRTFYHHVRRLIKKGVIQVVTDSAPPEPRTYRQLPAPEEPRWRSLPKWKLVLRKLMIDALTAHGTVRKAARSIGMSKSTFSDRMREYEI